jgi:sarcosine oxidase subunit gamma
MAESAAIASGPLSPLSALAGHAQPGRHGHPDGAPGLRLVEQTGLSLVSLAARKGCVDELRAAIRDRFGLDLPMTPRWVGDATLAILWAGPAQWLVVAADDTGDLETALRGMVGPLASVTDQGHGRVVLRLSGVPARDVLAKGMELDLHPRAFGPGDTALTQFAHVGVHIRQIDATPDYEILAFRSMAASLCEALVAAGAEYGIEVAVAG